MLGRVLIEVAFYMAIGYGAVLSAPLIAVAVVCVWGVLLLLYVAIRLQTPKDIDPEVSLGDVLRMNWFKLVHGLVRPYIPRMQNSTLKVEALRELADKEFDVVQAHDSYAVEAAEALAKRHKHTRLVFDAVEVFKEMSGGAFQRLPKWYANRLHDDVARRMKRSADRVITFGSGAAEFMAEEYDIRKPDLIRNCRGYLEIKPDTRLREDAGLGKGDKAVVMLNTLYQGQGLEQVIEAMQHLPDDVHICTIGWDTGRGYMDDCFRMAEKAGVIDRLHFMGRRPTWDLVPYASGGDIALMPRQLNNNLNNYYSMPNRIFEAIMARLPLACSSLRDVKHLVETMDAGMAFDETDPKDIARVISYLLEPENLKHYKHQTEQAARLLCWENESRSYVRIMEAVARDDRFYRQEEFTDAYEVEPEYLAMLKRKLKEAAQPEKVTGGDEQDAEKARAVA